MVAKLQPGCGEGVAELGDRLGPNTVHPGKISLGHLGELLQGDIPGRGQRLPSRPGQAGGHAWVLMGPAARPRGDQPGEVGQRVAQMIRRKRGNPMCWRRKPGTADQS